VAAPRPSPADMVSLAERKALRWYRAHGPAEISEPGAPARPVRLLLIRNGWVQITPKRRRFDPITYDITEEGRKVIDQCQ
jgi:hypothetical protein